MDQTVVDDANEALSLFPDASFFPTHHITKLKDIEHQLDIWHKAKNIGKAVLLVSHVVLL